MRYTFGIGRGHFPLKQVLDAMATSTRLVSLRLEVYTRSGRAMPSGFLENFVGFRGCRIDILVQHLVVFFLVKPSLVNRCYHSKAEGVVVGGCPPYHSALLWPKLSMEPLVHDRRMLNELRGQGLSGKTVEKGGRNETNAVQAFTCPPSTTRSRKGLSKLACIHALPLVKHHVWPFTAQIKVAARMDRYSAGQPSMNCQYLFFIVVLGRERVVCQLGSPGSVRVQKRFPTRKLF